MIDREWVHDFVTENDIPENGEFGELCKPGDLILQIMEDIHVRTTPRFEVTRCGETLRAKTRQYDCEGR